MAKKDSSSLSEYKFDGKTSGYQKFKSKLLAYLEQEDVQQLEDHIMDPKKKIEPKVTRVGLLTGDVKVPSKEPLNNRDYIQYRSQLTKVRTILNVVLPDSFSMSKEMNQINPKDIWNELERRYGTSTSISIGKTLTRFDMSTCDPQYDSVDQLMEQSRKRFNQLNTELKSLLKRKADAPDVIDEEILAIHVLRCLPEDKAALVPASEPEHFKVDTMFKAIKQHVTASSQKRKGGAAQVNHVTKRPKQAGTVPNGTCFYCLKSGHLKLDCAVRANDRKNKVYRSSINHPISTRRDENDKSTVAVNTVSLVKVESDRDSNVYDSDQSIVNDADMLDEIVQVNTVSNSMSHTGIESPLSLDTRLENSLPEEQVKVIEYLYGQLSGSYNTNMWVLDSGSGHSITNEKGKLKNRVKDNSISFETPIKGCSLGRQQIRGSQSILLNSNKGISEICLPNISYVSQFNKKIISEYSLRRLGYRFLNVANPMIKVMEKEGELIVSRAIDGVYYLEPTRKGNATLSYINNVTALNMHQVESSLKQWHLRLGHLGKSTLIKMMAQGLVDGMPRIPQSALDKVNFFCNVCAEAKHNRMSYRRRTGSRASCFGHTIHSDTMEVEVVGRFGKKLDIKYIRNFIDDYSSYKWIFFNNESNGKCMVNELRQIAEQNKTQHGAVLKCIRADGGPEFDNKRLEQYTITRGIRNETSNAYCPEENGGSERYNQTLMNATRSMLLGAGMAKQWWPEAAAYAHYLLLRLPTRRLQGK